MRLGFVTCVELGLSCMEAIYEVGGSLELAITLKDEFAKNKSGRVYIDEFCEENKVYLYKISHINDEEVISLIRSKKIDWLFIVGWSQIASLDVINAASLGTLGMHPTLLPTGRGRAAIPWAIIKNLPETGVTLFKLDEGVDTGPIVTQCKIPLPSGISATELYELSNKAHVDLIKNIVPKLEADNVVLQVQNNELATEWLGRKPEDGLISKGMLCEEVDKLVRAVTHPYPGAYWEQDDGVVLRVWKGKILQYNYQDSLSKDDIVIELSDGLYKVEEWERDNFV